MNERFSSLLLAGLVCACGSDAGQSPGDPWYVVDRQDVQSVQQYVVEELAERDGWEHLYQSDHGNTRTEMTFGSQQLEVFLDDFESFREDNPHVHLDGTGTWSVDERGVVTMEWAEEGYGFVDERTWAFVSTELADVLREQDPHSRGVWPSTGYLAQDDSLTRFHHRHWRQSDMQGTEQGGGTAELTLSATPTQLANGAACTMRLEITITNRDSSAEEVFEWNCTTEAVDGFYQIRANDLPEEPTVSDWEELLEAASLKDRYEYGVFATLRDAAFPALWFDPARPEVLVTDGYGETLFGFEPEDHDEP